MAAANRLHDYYRLPWPLACAGAVCVLILLNLIVTVGFVLAVPRLLQDIPRDETKQQELYEKFRSRIDAISPVPLDPQYFPEKAVDSVAFKYVQDLLSGPYIANAIVHFTGYIGNWIFELTSNIFYLLIESVQSTSAQCREARNFLLSNFNLVILKDRTSANQCRVDRR